MNKTRCPKKRYIQQKVRALEMAKNSQQHVKPASKVSNITCQS